MKRLLSILIILLMMISIVGCSKEQLNTNKDNNLNSTNSNTPNETNETNENKDIGQVVHNKELESAASDFVNLLVLSKYSEAHLLFDDNMKKAVSMEKLKNVWEEISSQLGGVQKQLGARTEVTDKYSTVFITCEFKNSSMDVKVVYNEDKKISGFFIVPTKIKPAAKAQENNTNFSEEEITFGTDKWKLPGTLTLPKGKTTFPTVILVHGSGASDRDETFGPNKPFKDLAEGLTEQGIAVLRYDKRTYVYAQEVMNLSTGLTVQTETIDDVIAAYEFLCQRKDIDKDKIFIIGHSLGGTLIPRIGTQLPHTAGLISLAGATTPLEDLILTQYTYIFSADGTITEKEQEALDSIKAAVLKIKSSSLSKETPSKELLNVPAEYWLDLKDYKPEEVAKELKQPLLILQGERDYQVPMSDFNHWKAALSSKDNVKFQSYPKLNHLFLEGKGEGKSYPEEYNIAGHIPKDVILDIADWIKSQ